MSIGVAKSRVNQSKVVQIRSASGVVTQYIRCRVQSSQSPILACRGANRGLLGPPLMDSTSQCLHVGRPDQRVSLDLSWSWLDSAIIEAAKLSKLQKGCETGRNPMDQGKLPVKRHVVTDGAEMPLAAVISSTNVHDKKMAFDMRVIRISAHLIRFGSALSTVSRKQATR